MARLGLAALLRRLGDNPSSAVIFLHGPEEFLRERAVAAVIDRTLDPATRDFNLDQLRGGDTTADGLASLLATPPMMADRRVVVVRDVQGLSVKAREVVEAAAAAPSAGLVLILVGAIPSGSKAKFYDNLHRLALSVEFAQVDSADLPGWLIEHAESAHGVEIELDAARAWSAAIGSELGVLVTEVEKAVAYIGDRKRITREDVKAVGGYIPRVDRWAWMDLVGERKFVEALEQVPELLESGENGVGLVIALASHVLKLGMLVDGGREGLERNLSGNQRWLANKLPPQARKWNLGQIDRAVSELVRADKLLKSASLGDRAAIEELLLRLADDSGAPKGIRMPRRTTAAASLG